MRRLLLALQQHRKRSKWTSQLKNSLFLLKGEFYRAKKALKMLQESLGLLQWMRLKRVMSPFLGTLSTFLR
jgi:hypothetical protein